MGKSMVSGSNFPLNQSIDMRKKTQVLWNRQLSQVRHVFASVHVMSLSVVPPVLVFTLKRHSVEDPYLNEGHSMRPPGNSDAGYIPPGLPLGGILLGDRDCFQHLSRTCSLQRCHILVISQGGQEHTTPFRIAHIHHLGVILGQTWPLLSVVSYQRGRN